ANTGGVSGTGSTITAPSAAAGGTGEQGVLTAVEAKGGGGGEGGGAGGVVGAAGGRRRGGSWALAGPRFSSTRTLRDMAELSSPLLCGQEEGEDGDGFGGGGGGDEGGSRAGSGGGSGGGSAVPAVPSFRFSRELAATLRLPVAGRLQRRR
ncbi:unnamed protein product, partial [Ectocarpus sp. 12 AP-2014]